MIISRLETPSGKLLSFSAGAPSACFASAEKRSEAQGHCEIEREIGKERKNQKVVRKTEGKMEQNLMCVRYNFVGALVAVLVQMSW